MAVSLGEQLTNSGFRFTGPARLESSGGERDERGARLSGEGAGEQGLSGPGPPRQQETPRRTTAAGAEKRGIL